MAMASREPVLIIGAGLVGSTLAQALGKRGVPYRIFERSSLEGREDFGWAVTLHWGVQHLKRLLPASVYEITHRADANPEATAANELATMTTFDLQTGKVIYRPGAPTGRRRVRRKQFGQCLLEGVTVEWSKQLSGISPSPSLPPSSSPSTITATFADGTTATGSMLVGCDGANSTARRLLLPSSHATTELPCKMMGVTAVLTRAQAARALAIDPFYFQALDRRGDRLLFFSFLDSPGNNSRGDAQRDTYAAQIIVGWPSRGGGSGQQQQQRPHDKDHDGNGVDDENYCPPDLLPPPTDHERLALMKRWAQGWAEPFASLVACVPEGSSVNVVRVGDWLPPGGSGGAPRWDNLDGRVTLAGDAAHPMTMYRGEAYNHGLRDLEELVDGIAPLYDGKKSSQGALEGGAEWERARKGAVDRYEEDMLDRAYAAVLMSRQAALDAHDQTKMDGDSPFLRHRSVEGPCARRGDAQTCDCSP